MEDKIVTVSSGRRIIYVDATFNKDTNESKISLFDPEINQKNILVLNKPSSISKAEQCAILYGCLYVKKMGIENRKVYILNDNQAAVNNTKIINVCKKLNIGISWIPREINEIADEGTKSDTNMGNEESNILSLFYELVIESESERNTVSKNDETKNITILKNAINHSKNEQKPYVSIGQVGKYLKANNPTYKYSSLKNELLKYENNFAIVDKNYVKILK